MIGVDGSAIFKDWIFEKERLRDSSWRNSQGSTSAALDF